MLFEIATSGVGMAMIVTAVWAVMVGVTNSIEKAPAKIRTAMTGGKQ